jgi:hypothetical protein
MAGGATARVQPGKRKGDPMLTRNGKPRLGPLNITQLTALADKTQRKKDKSKISREIARKQARLVV